MTQTVLPTSRKKALIRRPSPRLAEGIVSHIEREPVDVELAAKQWHEYVATLQDHGWHTVDVPPADHCPDGVFIEDPVVVYRSVAVIARPGALSRRPETDAVEPVVRSLGYAVHQIADPGTLDGGDVLKVGDTVYVGRGGRTNPEGIRQLRAILAPLGATVVAVPVHAVLHLKSAVTALPDGTVIGWPPAVDVPSMFPRYLPVPEESGAHVVDLGHGRILMAADCPRSAELFADLGYEPVVVDISEFEKLEGCVTCLSVRLRTPPR
ncbi:MAG TPA: N(G),N(G)-dimethylarginine dimethylaminohydrolase [Acidimicrobiales bacterium]|nr:N(G),N(G)-dimethylarginine dimethylaminohydrolase [Acidimicrobiales bacterium]